MSIENIDIDIFLDKEKFVEGFTTEHYSAVLLFRHALKEDFYKLEIIPLKEDGSLEDDALTWFYIRGKYHGARMIEAGYLLEDLESRVKAGKTPVEALAQMDQEDRDTLANDQLLQMLLHSPE